MTQSAYSGWGDSASRLSWVENCLRPAAQLAKQHSQLLWIHFAPSFEKEAQLWIEEVQAANLEVLKHFRIEKMDSLLHPELDQAAQTLMQSMTGAKGWPVNLVIEADTLKPIIGFSALEIKGLTTLLEQLSSAWIQDPKRLQEFAEMSYFKATSQDPLRFASDAGQCFSTLDEAFHFFLAPIAQSFSAETGSFGAGDSHLLYPAAYLCLAEDSWRRESLRSKESAKASGPNFGEVALSTLIRGPGFDALTPSFFRVSLARGADALPTSSWVKCLHENAEMLDVLIKVWQRSQSPFLFETAVGLIGTLLDEFVEGEGNLHFSSWIAKNFEELTFTAQDLLSLPPELRAVAQEFFDLRNSAKLPTLANSVEAAAKALGKAPQDTLLMVQQVRRELAELRKKRSAWKRGPVDRSSECRALEAICFALNSLQSEHLELHVLPRIVPMIRAALVSSTPPTAAHPRELSARCGLKLEAFELLSRVQAHSRLIKTDFSEEISKWANDLKNEILALQFMDVTIDTGFLGTRYDLVDHFGASGMAEQLRVLSRASRPLTHGSYRQLFEKGEAFIFEECLLSLSRVKRLGLVSASLYAGVCSFFEGREAEMQAGRQPTQNV